MSSAQTVQAIAQSLSRPRFSTYERAVVAVGDPGEAALALYEWNAQISGAFMAPLHICEIVSRNAVSDALTALSSPNWPWSPAFERSLHSARGGYDPRGDLVACRTRASTTGKVIPELKFVFWQNMFTGRHDKRVWDVHLRRVLPNLGSGKTVAQLRREIYEDLDHVRVLRNRIAHHEPIFRRNLAADLATISALVRSRCVLTADWMMRFQRVTRYLERGAPTGS